MIVNPYIYSSRDVYIDGIDLDKLRDTFDLYGYLPEASIIPPFFVVERKASNQTNNRTSKPIIHYVTKTQQQWRDFKVVKPENYVHTVDLILNNYDAIKRSLKNSEYLISFSNPFTFESSALRSGHQISQWHALQQSLFSNSSKYRLPYLLQIDLQNCYHTIYTHTIEWAMDAIGEKELGDKLDTSIRRGNNNHTHGLPVGQFPTDVVAEIVLTNMDNIIEMALDNINCMGFRFKDNYYFLCEDYSKSELVLSKVASELRNNHLSINDSKTEMGPFTDFYSSRWQADYDYLLESLQLHNPETKFTNTKLKVFIEQVVALSFKYDNKKSILEKAINLITTRQFIGHINYKWLFYAVSNMLPLRTLSYPKIISFMKKITYENKYLLEQEYNNFLKNELSFAHSRRDTFALMWLAYILVDTNDVPLKELLVAFLQDYEADNKLIAETLKYLNGAKGSSTLWDSNESRLDIRYKEYMSPEELHKYLGVNFAES